MQRIVVVGTTGSGKSTLAGQLADRLGIPYVELDALNWGPNWTMRPADIFQESVERATAGETWVVDGNYSRVRDLLWTRADTVIWLDYPLPVIMWRLWWRTWSRWLRRVKLWHGNHERMRVHLFSRDSLFLWALQTYRRRRRTYSDLFTGHNYPHLTYFHFRSSRETKAWLTTLQKGG